MQGLNKALENGFTDAQGEPCQKKFPQVSQKELCRCKRSDDKIKMSITLKRFTMFRRRYEASEIIFFPKYFYPPMIKFARDTTLV